ncbi:hypothetical protein H4J38_03860 [Colwellia sp. BRX10-3]|uniref:PKD domain-containing protein n=1 Tax=Colwellia sp. BRX10-3 TaxID=2759844 RepID=UPI0015F702D1|nr:hypothetical protein [Colwellia sp. BRX10-3]MBA6389912.1 hypothetical protein [Colwellia sp. BRX10-3]
MKKTSIAIMLSSILLSACGDSESKDEVSTPPPSENVAPTASFTLANDLQERAEFTIDGANSSDSDGSISTYNWTIDLGQYSGENISLNQNNASATLVVGEIAEDVTATITLTVTDNDNSTDEFSSTVIISELDVAMLPPMPIEPDLGLTGTDSDNDGVRDDLEIAIYKLYPLSKDNREVSRNAVLVFNNVLVTGDSIDDLDDGDASEKLAKLASCYIDHTDLNGRHEVAKIKALTFDTEERLKAFEKYKVGRNGTVQRTVEATFDECRLPQN